MLKLRRSNESQRKAFEQSLLRKNCQFQEGEHLVYLVFHNLLYLAFAEKLPTDLKVGEFSSDKAESKLLKSGPNSNFVFCRFRCLPFPQVAIQRRRNTALWWSFQIRTEVGQSPLYWQLQGWRRCSHVLMHADTIWCWRLVLTKFAGPRWSNKSGWVAWQHHATSMRHRRISTGSHFQVPSYCECSHTLSILSYCATWTGKISFKLLHSLWFKMIQTKACS